MEATAFFLLLVVLPGSLSSPLSWDYQNDARNFRGQCSDRCTGSNKFLYQPDQTYRYNYEVATSTSMHGASDDVARIDVTAVANIHVISKCEMVLSLDNVAIRRSEGGSLRMTDVNDWTFKMALERNPLRFSFQDGLVDDLCPSSREEPESLNFKRGVLSAFQNSMGQHTQTESVRETDVTGTCPTEYSIHQEGWKTKQITKVKDLLGCTHRHRFTSALQATPFHAPDAIHSLPLLKGDHKCTHVLSSDRLLTSSTCIESLVFRPFSRREAGARTHTTQKLTHVRTMSGIGVRNGDIDRRTTLLFEHNVQSGSDDDTLYSTRAKLAELCRATTDAISAEVPGLFTDMVYLMRRLTGEQFTEIAEGVHRGNICDNNKERAKKFFDDALPMVGTSASVQVMVELLLSGDVTGMQAQLWLKSLHFLPQPTQDMVAHTRRLLTSNDLRMTAFLPVTTLVSHYCKVNTDCSTNEHVREIALAIEDVFSGDCQTYDEGQVLTALRAAGNLGFADQLAASLDRCSNNDGISINTRVTAMHAYRGVTCAVQRRAPMNIFTTKEEDSELRIAAYIAVMQCPDEEVLTQVKRQLEQEEINQVGSFVWTHLTNLQETSTLHKQAVRDILQDEQLRTNFDLDKRKFSRNYEISYFSQEFGLGGAAEGNLIWSEKSFVPRSAMLNLTVDILGHTVNLLEVGGRVQGMEEMLQEALAKQEFFKGGRPTQGGGSSKCVKQQKMRNMKNKFAVEKDALSASMYLRVFGNEIGYTHMNDGELRGLHKTVGSDFIKSLAQGRDISWTQSALFMDSTMHVPTASGMPLSLSVNATASLDVQADGKLDLQKLSLSRMIAMFDVRPSAAVQFSGRMSLGLGATQAGLKMVTSLHTSTALTGNLDLTNGQMLNIELDTPQRNMDILNVRSELFIQHDNTDRSLRIKNGRQVAGRSCSSDQVLQFLGYQTCAETSFVRTIESEEAPYYPFTGPTTVSVSMQKKDAPRGFKFIGKHIKDEKSYIGLLSLDTPGSREDRALSLGFTLDTDARSGELDLNSPWASFLAKGAYTGDENSHRLAGNVRLDDKEHSLLVTSVRQMKKGKTIWKSTIAMERPQDSTILPQVPKKFSASSEVSVSDQEIAAKMTINTGLRPGDIDLKMDMINTNRRKSVAASVTLDHDLVYSGTVQLMQTNSRGGANVKLEPTILVSAPKWRIFLLSGTIDYKKDRILRSSLSINMDKTLKDPIKLETKVTKQKKKTNDRYRGFIKLNSHFARISTSGFATVQTKGNFKLSNRIKLDYNIPLIKSKRERKNRLVFSSKIHDRSTKALKKYDVTFNCDNKLNREANFMTKAELNHKNALTKAEVTIGYGKSPKTSKDINAQVLVNHKLSDDEAEVTFNTLFIYPTKKIEYQVRGKHEHHLIGRPRFETYLTTIIGKGKSSELRVSGVNRSKKNRLDMTGGLEVSLPAFKTLDGQQVAEQRYTVGSTLKQSPSKEYIHTINLKMNEHKKHSMVTRMRLPSEATPNRFNLLSKLELDLDKYTTVTVKTDRKSDDLHVSGTYLAGTQAYNAELTSRKKNMQWSNSWDISWPERHVKGSLEAGQKRGTTTDINFVTYWDADRDESKKINFDLHHLLKKDEGQSNYYQDLMANLTTPFEGHKIYSYRHLSQFNKGKLTDELKIIWREPNEDLSYKLMVDGPFSERPLAHNNVLIGAKVSYKEHHMSVELISADKSNAIKNDISGSLIITSSVPEIREFKLALKHQDDGRVFSAELDYGRNGRNYHAKMDATYMRVHYQVTADATLHIDLPYDRPYNSPLKLRWQHTNTLTHLNSTISLDWLPEYTTKVIVGGKGSKAENNWEIDLAVVAPGTQPHQFELQLRQNMMSGYQGSAHWRLNSNPRISTTISYLFTDREFKVEYSGEGRTLIAKTHYQQFPYTAIVKAEWDAERGGQDHTILMEASVNNLEDLSVSAKLVTPWKGVKNVDVRSTMKKLAETKWEFDSLVSLGVRREIITSINVDLTGLGLYVKIETPFDQMTKMALGWKHEQEDKTYDSEVLLEVQPHFDQFKVAHSTTVDESDVKSLVSLRLPGTDIASMDIRLDHSSHRRGYNTHVNVAYSNDQNVDLKVKTRYNANKFPENSKLVADLVTSPTTGLPGANLKVNMDKRGGKWVGKIDVKTESEKLRRMIFKAEHANDATSSDTDVELTSSLFETVTAGAHLNWGPHPRVNVSLDAPGKIHSSIGFIKRNEAWTDFHNKIFAELNNKRLDLEVGMKHNDAETRGWVVYSHPGAQHSDLKASAHRVGVDFTDFDVGAFLKLGRDNKPYNVSAQYSLVPEQKYTMGTTLATPFTKHVSYFLQYKTAPDRTASTTVYGKYGEEYFIDLKSSQKMGDTDFQQTTDMAYRFDELRSRSGSSVTAQWLSHLQTAIMTSYRNDDTMTLHFTRSPAESFGVSGTEKIDVSLTSTYEGYTDVGLVATLTTLKNGAQHEGNVRMEYMDDQEAGLTFFLTIPKKNRASLDAVLTLPLEGYERSKISYNHMLREDRISADAEFIAGTGRSLSANFKLDNKEDFTLTLNGPMEGLQNAMIDGKYDAARRQVIGKASYKIRANRQPQMLNYDITYHKEPVGIDMKLVNQEGKEISFHMSHDGQDWREFKNVVKLNGAAVSIGDWHKETYWRYASPIEFSGRSEMTSNYQDVEMLKVSFGTSKHLDEQLSEMELDWGGGRKISITQGWAFDSEDYSSASLRSEISTPFPEVTDASVKFSYLLDRDSLTQDIALVYNSKNKLEANLDYRYLNNRHQAVILVTNPQPMTFSGEGAFDEHFFDGKLNLDWDKNSPEGRVEFVSSYMDRSIGEDIDTAFKFKVNHPVRIMGVDCQYKEGQNEFRSSGLVTWDQERGNTFSYDLGWANRTSRYSRSLEGHCKVGVPQRSVKYQGSYSDTDRTVTTSSAFFWHADRDESKKVVMTTNVEKNDNFNRVGMNINIPCINKQLNLGATTKGSYGQNRMDTRAEISYSSDPDKTITVTSVLSNSEPETSSQGYNYSMVLGFEHPVSGIDLTMTSHLAQLTHVSSMASDFSFQDVNGRRQSFNIYTKMDNRNRKFEWRASSPFKSLGVMGLVRPGHHNRTIVSALISEDDQQALKLDLVADPARRRVELEFNYDKDNRDKMVSLSGGFLNDSSILVELTSQDNRRDTAELETLVALRLKSSQLLYSRVQWKPNVDHEIKTYLTTKLTEFSYATNDFLKKFVRSLGREVKGKYVLVSDELKTELSQVFDLMEQEMNDLNAQLDTLWIKYRRFHQHNEMFIRDMGDQVAWAFQEINEGMLTLVSNYRTYYLNVNQATRQWLEHLRTYPIAQAYQAAVDDIAVGLGEVESALENMLAVVVTQLKELLEEGYREYQKMSRHIDRKLDSYARSLHELPLYRKMVAQRDMLGTEVPEWVEWYDKAYVKFQEVIQEQYHDFMTREEFKHMFAIGNEIIGQMKHYTTDNTLGSALTRVSEMSKNLVLMELAKLKKTLVDFRKSRVISYDQENGELEFEVYLPVPLTSLADVPALRPPRYIRHAQRLVKSHIDSLKSLIPAGNTSVWDLYYEHVPSLQPHTWVPPFEASAYLIGSQHFITFDNSEFDFLSTCSHVLARDVANDMFSVSVNYGRRARRDGVESLCFTMGDLSFDISDKYELQVSKQKAEMPYITDQVKIVREGDFIRVQSIKGLEVLLNPVLDLYKVTVSGWYHGRLAGLLGSYDNEQHNDKFTDQLAADVEVNRRSCNGRNLSLKPDTRADREGVCASVFEDQNSKFRPCFKQVDPASFMQLCETYLRKMPAKKAARLASEQYRFVCQGQGVYIGAMEGLATCGQDQPSYQINGTIVEEKSADVIFVLEDNQCNQWARSSLPSMVTQIDEILGTKGFSSNRFGLQGYGGPDQTDVSTRTIDGQHFGEATHFLKALETFRFSEYQGGSDLAQALTGAANYPFRAGVAKVMIIVPCSACEVSFMDSPLASHLKSKGFQVHALQEKGFSTSDHKIFGVHKNRLIMEDPLEVNGFLKDDQPSDFCQDLAHDTEGVIFDTAHFTSSSAVKRNFIKTFSTHVALNARVPGCLKCQCDADTQCNVCDTHSSYLEPFMDLPQAVGALYDATHDAKTYFGNSWPSVIGSSPDNYLLLGA